MRRSEQQPSFEEPRTVGALARRSSPEATSAPQAVIPTEIRELLGPPPLTSSEDADAYERILTSLAVAIRPRDFIEWTWLRELADLGWEAQRGRRAMAVSLALARKSAIERLLEAHRPKTSLDLDKLFDGGEHWRDVEAIYDGDSDRLAELQETVERLGLSQTAVDDAAFLVARETIEKLQDLVDRASARRDAVVREIERRRKSLAERAPSATEALEPATDAEFE